MTDEYWQKKNKIMEICFGSVLFAICLINGFMSYPTLEAWSLWRAWDTKGPGFFFSVTSAFAERPLHLVPSFAAWILPGPYDSGLIVVGFFLAISRWLLAEIIARQFKLNGFLRYFFIFLIVAMPAWQHSGFERFHAAQAAVSLFLAAISCLKQHELSNSKLWFGLSITSAMCSLMTYQSMALVMVLFPFLFAVGRKEDRRFATLSAMALIGSFVAYLLFRAIIIRFFPDSYSTKGARNLFALECLYLPYLGVRNAGLLSILALLSICIQEILPRRDAARPILARILLPVCVFLIAPFSALVFNQDREFKMVDPGRMMGPIQTFMTVSLLAFRPDTPRIPMAGTAWINRVAMATCVLAYIQNATTVLYCITMQVQFFDQMRSLTKDFTPESKVLILDQTGVIGNVYTIFHGTINILAKSNDIPGTYKIYRASNVQRKWAPGSFHPAAIAPTFGPDQKAESFDHVLVVRPSRKWMRYPVTISISDSQQEMDLHD